MNHKQLTIILSKNETTDDDCCIPQAQYHNQRQDHAKQSFHNRVSFLLFYCSSNFCPLLIRGNDFHGDLSFRKNFQYFFEPLHSAVQIGSSFLYPQGINNIGCNALSRYHPSAYKGGMNLQKVLVPDNYFSISNVAAYIIPAETLSVPFTGSYRSHKLSRVTLKTEALFERGVSSLISKQ